MPPVSSLLRYTVVALVLLLATLISTSSAQDVCISIDSANPIAELYPTTVTGNLNGTTLIIPIPLASARELLPQEYGILEDAYRSLLPSFPEGMYPLMVTAKHDHDVQLFAYNLSIADFTVCSSLPLKRKLLRLTFYKRASFEFPFLDILGDGYTSYRMQKTALITASNEGAVTGAAGYGVNVYPAVFDPPCDAYKSLGHGGSSFRAATTPNSTEHKFLEFESHSCPQDIPYPFDFIKNITNQVTFANTTICDHYQLLFNTSLTTGPFEPRPVVATVTARLEPFNETQTWAGVYGWQYAAAFLEPPVSQSCLG